ncbi:polyhomeotic-like protein 3 [Xenentodon cancila]
MDKELVQQNQSERATNGTSPQTPTSTLDPSTPTPTPPRLTPNPMLLDSPSPTLTPTTSSPPPPLTPAPSVSATHRPKATAAVTAAASSLSPHILVPAPPKLTSTVAPGLRTYSRPILPSLSGASKAPPTTQTSTSSSCPVTTAAVAPMPLSSPPSCSTATSNAMPTKTSTSLTNGNSRPGSTPTPITPFHTPASPPGRQVSQVHPGGTPGLVRANQSPSPVRQRVSQQALLLGKGLKGSGQDQVLLRAQMLILTSAMRPPQSSSSSSSSCSSASSSIARCTQLQSLTLRPPPPGALTIPPSLRLKPPSSVPPPLSSRPQGPLFPPLRPRPQPSTTATETRTTPSRHLSVPPPTLYSPVRAVPLKPRVHSPNSHKVAPPRQSSSLHPIAAAPSGQASAGRSLAGLKSCPLAQTMLGPAQTQHSLISNSFERSPSAARQLQIIALSSGRQPPSSGFVHTVAQSTPAVVESPETSSHSKRTVGGEDAPPLPPNPSLPKASAALPSPPSLLSPTSPSSQTMTQTQTVNRKGEVKDGEEQGEKGKAVKPVTGDEEGTRKDMQVEKEDQRETAKVEKRTERRISQEAEAGAEENPMEVTEEGERYIGGSEEKKMEEEKEDGEVPMDQSGSPTSLVLHHHHTTYPNRGPDAVKDSAEKVKPLPGIIPVPAPVPAPAPAPAPVPAPAPAPVPVPVPAPAPAPVPAPEVSVQSQRLPEPHQDAQPVSQDDFCEDLSTQSDNQSALSSLSSQSPPSSPFITPSTENPPPLLPAQTAHATDLSVSQREVDKVNKTLSDIQDIGETEAESLNQSQEESESLSQSLSSLWEPKAWPEGRQVLTHLVEGFVIQEGLQPFPVNRSSLLVPDQVTTPQEVNGTNGRAPFPVTDTTKQAEHSTDSDEDEGGDTDDPGARPGHRDRTVLHCQFCGKRGHAHNFMRSKRFCSTSCARGFNVRLTKRLRALSAGSRSERPRPALNRAESVPGKPLLLRLPRDLWSAGRREKEGKEKAAERQQHQQEEDEEDLGGGREEEDDDGGEEDPAVAMTARMEHRAVRRERRASAPAVTTSMPTTTFKPAPSQWSVEEVTAFIHTLPGCSDVAEAFRLQEIDGQALLLLTEDHLMSSMNIKLGPALKICAHINALKNQ